MNALPVIVRELRAKARNPYNWPMRVTVAALAILVFVWATWSEWRYRMYGLAMPGGEQLFTGLEILVFFCICVLSPILTADCLSRELREGTLGLLFLTPLTPVGIVLAKSVVHALRSLSLLLVVVPVMTVAILKGGVGMEEVLLALVTNFTALMLGLGAGVLASASTDNWNRAVALAIGLSAIFQGAFWKICSLELNPVMGLNATGALVIAPFTLGMGTAALRELMLSRSLMCVTVCLFVCGIVRWAAAIAKARWQHGPKTVLEEKYREQLCTPRYWSSRFRSKMRRALDRNPIGWLHQYSWTARITKWGWCLGVVLLETWAVIFDFENYGEWQTIAIGLLLLGLSFSAANSFIRERRSGAMELILVTPLAQSQIVFGRMKGIWAQFLPALVALGICLAQRELARARWGEEFEADLLYGLMYAASAVGVLPCIGLCFSLGGKNFIGAWLATVFFGLLMPWIGGGVARIIFGLLWEVPIELRYFGIAALRPALFLACAFYWWRVWQKRRPVRSRWSWLPGAGVAGLLFWHLLFGNWEYQLISGWMERPTQWIIVLAFQWLGAVWAWKRLNRRLRTRDFVVNLA